MFRVMKGIVLIMVEGLFNGSGVKRGQKRATISEVTMTRTVRLPDMIWIIYIYIYIYMPDMMWK